MLRSTVKRRVTQKKVRGREVVGCWGTVSPGQLFCEVVLEQSPGEDQREKWHMWTRTFQVVGSVTKGGQLRGEWWVGLRGGREQLFHGLESLFSE